MGMIIDASLGLEGIADKGHDMFKLGGPIQSFIDSTVLKGVEPYVPMRVGTATRSGILHSRIGYGMLVWKTPYIRYIFHGKSASGNDLVYDQSRHPLAGKEWPTRYKADHLQELTGMVRGRVKQLW